MAESGTVRVEASAGGCEAPPRFSIVGIGSSAGGLEALSALISHLPDNLNVSYVVVQHMSPNHRSLLAQLLGRETGMEVKEVEDAESPRPNVIYITPPNRNVSLEGDVLRLSEPAPHSVPKPSVNAFFTSLAEARGEETIAVVLSGTGSDGANGVRAVKSAGGLVIAQSPTSAKYQGMPQSAIDTGCVDLVLTPDAIAAEIALVIRTVGTIQLPAANSDAPTSIASLLSRVLRHTRVDFSGYKENTVWRRVLRRMTTNRVATLEQYIELTERNPDELGQLCKEILISVTSFFRDRESFEALKALLRLRLETKSPKDEFRVWVPGCATGEEAYSIAIMLHTLLDEGAPAVRVQVFATDIDMNAMSTARRGIYSTPGLSELPPDLLRRYFVPVAEGYEISKQIRELVVFARQDLIQDPPFLRLDLISCRNVLIYFQPLLQERVLSSFHYALQEDGLLFLGKSESVQHRDELFAAVSRDGKIFTRRDGPARPSFSVPGTSAKRYERTRRERTPLDRLLEVAANAYVPPSVLLDASGAVLQVFGDVGGLLKIQPGRPDLNVSNLIRKDLRTELQTLIHRCRQQLDQTAGRARVEIAGDTRGIRMVLRPVPGAHRDPTILLSFEPLSSRASLQGSDDPTAGSPLGEVESELLATRETLQTLIEELETSNEEGQALNEELQSSNEELQAANEELQSANEELQSTNEELTTVNEELQIKTAELVDVNSDLESILDSVGFALIMVSEQMRIQRANKLAAQFFSLPPGTAGIPLERALAHRRLESCSALVADVLSDGNTREQRVEAGGHHYQVKCTARRTLGIGVTGAVLTMIDETDLIDTQFELQESRKRLMSILDNANSLIAIKSPLGRYEFANPRFMTTFGTQHASLVGLVDEDFMPSEEAERVRHADLTVLASGRTSEIEETFNLGGELRQFRSLRFALRDTSGEIAGLCVKLHEVTAYRRETAEWRAWMTSWREAVIGLADLGILEFGADRTITWEGGDAALMKPLARLGGGERTIQNALKTYGFDIRSFEGASDGLWQGVAPGLRAVAYFCASGGVCLLEPQRDDACRT